MISLNTGILVTSANTPLDVRTKVSTLANLTDGSIIRPYVGLSVWVTSEEKTYVITGVTGTQVTSYKLLSEDIDRKYNSEINTKGYKVLKVDIPLDELMTDTNTIYEVRNNFDLRVGEVIEVDRLSSHAHDTKSRYYYNSEGIDLSNISEGSEIRALDDCTFFDGVSIDLGNIINLPSDDTVYLARKLILKERTYTITANVVCNTTGDRCYIQVDELPNYYLSDPYNLKTGDKIIPGSGAVAFDSNYQQLATGSVEVTMLKDDVIYIGKSTSGSEVGATFTCSRNINDTKVLNDDANIDDTHYECSDAIGNSFVDSLISLLPISNTSNIISASFIINIPDDCVLLNSTKSSIIEPDNVGGNDYTLTGNNVYIAVEGDLFEGSYDIIDSITIPSNSELRFEGGKIINAVLKGNPGVQVGNVLDFGGDDDIVYAIENMQNIGITTIYIPYRDSIYEISRTIHLKDNVHLIGIGGGKPLLGTYENKSQLLLIDAIGSSSSRLEHIKIENIRFTSGTPTTERVKDRGGIINFDYVNDILISDVEMVNVFPHHGILFKNVDGAEVRRCKFNNFTYYMLGCAECTENIKVENCIFDTCTTTASTHSYLFATGVSNYNDTFNFRCRNIIVRNNIFKNNPRWEAIDSHGVRDMIIEGNIIENCLSGVMVRTDTRPNDNYSMENVVIRDNFITCTDPRTTISGVNGYLPRISNGIIVGGGYDANVTDEDFDMGVDRSMIAKNIIVENNTIKNAIRGLCVVFAKDVSIRDNSVNDFSDVGIYCSYVFRSVFDKNLISSHTEDTILSTAIKRGVYCVMSQALSFSDNTMNGWYHYSYDIDGTNSGKCYIYYFVNNKINVNKDANLRLSSSGTSAITALKTRFYASSKTHFSDVMLTSSIVNDSYAVGDSLHIRSSGATVDVTNFTLSNNILTYNSKAKITSKLAYDEEFELVFVKNGVSVTKNVFVKDIIDLNRYLLCISEDDTSLDTVLDGNIVSITKKVRKFICHNILASYTALVDQNNNNIIADMSIFYDTTGKRFIFVKSGVLYQFNGIKNYNGTHYGNVLPTDGLGIGQMYFRLDLKKPAFVYSATAANNNWRDAFGNPIDTDYIGSVKPTNVMPGTCFILTTTVDDTTTYKPLFYTGTEWIDATGTVIS